MPLQVFKKVDYEPESKSRKAGLSGRAPNRSYKKYSSQREKQPTFKMLLQVLYRAIMTNSQTLGNQELMERTPHSAHNFYSSQLVETAYIRLR